MAYISIKQKRPPEQEPSVSSKKIKQDLSHPIRVRIMSILLDGRPRTQRELGRTLLMSSAAIHYHLVALIELGVIRLDSTQPGPNGIIEKLYRADRGRWQEILKTLDNGVDVRFYLDYTAAWMNERHREGLEILKAGEHDHPFLLGSYAVQAPAGEIMKLKRDIWKQLDDFYKKHSTASKERQATCSVTFAILPSLASEARESLNALEYEPDESHRPSTIGSGKES